MRKTMKETIKVGDRGVVFGMSGTVADVTDGVRVLAFEADRYRHTTRPVMIVPIGMFKKEKSDER